MLFFFYSMDTRLTWSMHKPNQRANVRITPRMFTNTDKLHKLEQQFHKPAKNSGLNDEPATGRVYESTLLSGQELLICNTDKVNWKVNNGSEAACMPHHTLCPPSQNNAHLTCQL